MSSTAEAPHEPPPPAPPPVWRSPADRYLAGVAGGVGERLGLDPFLVRLALVAATLVLAGGNALAVVPLAYGVAWLVVADGERPSLVRRLRADPDARREAAVAVLLVAATMVLLPRLGPGGSGGLRLGIVLLGLGVLLLVDRSDRGAATTPPTPPTPDTTPPPSAPPLTTEPAVRRPPRPAVHQRLTELGRRRPPRGPAVWPLVASALVLWAVVCVVLDQVLDPGLRPGIAVSGALGIVGVILVVSAWRRVRPGSAIVVGAALVPLWAGFTVPGVERYPGTGVRTERPASAADAAAGYRLGYGRLVVDLRRVPLEPGEAVHSSVALTGGTARVRVPADARLVVRGDVGLGTVSINRYNRWDGSSEAVIDRQLRRSYAPVPRTCVLQAVPETGLHFTNGVFATIDDLDDELARRGWPTSRPAPRDVGPGPEDWVLVGVDEQWQLCDPTAPTTPADPATITLDVTVGIGTLEITREHID